jgi:hypothetical protein
LRTARLALLIVVAEGCGLDVVGGGTAPGPPAADGGPDAAATASDAGPPAEEASGRDAARPIDANDDGPPDAGDAAADAPAAPPALAIGVTPLVGALDVDLTTAGPIDWAYWPRPAPVRHVSGNLAIGSYQVTGAGVTARSQADYSDTRFTWGNGTAPPPPAPDPSYVYFAGARDAAVTFELAAGTLRTLALWAGCFEAECELEAELSDGSVVPQRARRTGAPLARTRFDVTFRGRSAAATVRVRWKLLTRTDDDGGLALGATALR